MTEQDTPTMLDVLEAITAYIECRAELAEALKAYDGYSPDYHFSRQILQRTEKERAAESALAAYIRHVSSAPPRP